MDAPAPIIVPIAGNSRMPIILTSRFDSADTRRAWCTQAVLLISAHGII
ncbi:MAG: hypothetical protein ACRYGI_02940 [Janthinobacterium lividum]